MATSSSIFSETGIILTLTLLCIPVVASALFLVNKAYRLLRLYLGKKELERINKQILGLGQNEIEALEQRKRELAFRLNFTELGSNRAVRDERGLIQTLEAPELRFIERKKKGVPRPAVPQDLSNLILWFIGSAVFWLVFGTTVGEYLGIKFSAPDLDAWSFLSFGRLRPVHTNAVFWGWASMAMLGLAHYVIPRVSNTALYSIKVGYWALGLCNLAVFSGSIALMAGINNGGGEYREYIWPIMAIFGAGILLSLWNLLKTISKRTVQELYVSNWYIVSAMMFLLVIVFVAYWPTWQNGLGETIIQGYYMHQGVGMWFMLFNLGLMYYFLPQQLNKPIYSYSLGVLAFWSQILFYTLIGTHHFIFSAIPWWLQTIAIIGSVGMIIPVIAGTTNFLLTFKGAWNKLYSSYTLPFYLVGILFYFTGSFQGTAEAFRFTNLLWHFTDFTVAHSHLTMYGIITFMLWGFIYTLVPRLTGREAKQATIGAHFWFALLGLLIYTIPLMYGSTLRGLMWIENKPFLESVTLMAPYWLWRAIGGTLMWISHLLFAYNFYCMVRKKEELHRPSTPAEILDIRAKLLHLKTNHHEHVH